MTTLLDLEQRFEEIHASKRLWSPRAFKADAKVSDEVLKVLAIGLALELPVGEFIEQASAKDLPGVGSAGRSLLKRNIVDEEVHYEAIQYAAAAFAVPQRFITESNAIAQAWISHPDHTLLKAAVLELGVFFPALAILRKSGSAALKLMSNDISRDESTHVNTNWTVADSLGYSTSKSLNSLRLATIDWIVGSSDRNGHWQQVSDRLISTRTAPELEYTQPAVSVAFFETDRSAQAGYYRPQPQPQSQSQSQKTVVG